MKRRRRHRSHRPQRLSITIESDWQDKAAGLPIAVAEVFAACFSGIDDAVSAPFAMVEEDAERHIFFCRVTGCPVLGNFSMVRLADIASADGLRALSAVEEVKRTLVEARLSGAVVDKIVMPQMVDGDEIKIPEIVCTSDLTTRSSTPIAMLMDKHRIGHAVWNNLPVVPVDRFQQVFEALISFLITETVLCDDDSVEVCFEGDLKWLMPDSKLATIIRSLSS